MYPVLLLYVCIEMLRSILNVLGWGPHNIEGVPKILGLGSPKNYDTRLQRM